jgi:hypothetical protein
MLQNQNQWFELGTNAFSMLLVFNIPLCFQSPTSKNPVILSFMLSFTTETKLKILNNNGSSNMLIQLTTSAYKIVNIQIK